MSILSVFELTGTFFFAISGALAVKDKEHDWFGAGFTGFITAIGGGSLRDVLLGSYPLAWINNVNLLYAIIAGVAVTYFGLKYLLRLRRTLFFFDTLGLSLFTILGTEKALSLGVQEESRLIAIINHYGALDYYVCIGQYVRKRPDQG